MREKTDPCDVNYSGVLFPIVKSKSIEFPGNSSLSYSNVFNLNQSLLLHGSRLSVRIRIADQSPHSNLGPGAERVSGNVWESSGGKQSLIEQSASNVDK